ncbi:unnamed protein product [Adineta steineri]|uniref:Uncharacterized protein n=2 Tax=Adineta steineri TaxID=433720 RepID=A0A815XIV8_9BILA|nr:unnamed protein product [Adineta steineri]CAF1663900.1 unnamed protein product [Adineta steineri]
MKKLSSTQSNRNVQADGHISLSTYSQDVRRKVSFAEQSTSLSMNTIAGDEQIEQMLDPLESVINTTSNSEHSTFRLQIPFMSNFRIIWLDSNFTKLNADFEYMINQLRHIIDVINPFTDPEVCKDFIRKKIDETIFLIVSNDVEQSIICDIHQISQIHCIFIFCQNKPKKTRWIKNWKKIIGFFMCINTIYERIKQETERHCRDSRTTSISSVDLNRFDTSFMYTLILREILSEMNYDVTAKKQLTQFYREYYYNDPWTQKDIDNFNQNYELHTPIWWYTRFPFLYERLNEALRLQKTKTIIKMGFFIKDLHDQIEQLYRPTTEKITVYRGQGLSYAHFNQLRTIEGGLYFFNCFLSTTADRQVALSRAESSCSIEGSGQIGILFQITLDPTVGTAAPFASLNNVSFYFDREQEILFSTHTVFRIGEIKSIGDYLWQVDLLLVSDDDDDLIKRIEYMRNMTSGTTGWDRLSKLLLKMDKFEEAKEVLEVSLENSNDNDLERLGHRYHLMGQIENSQHNYKQALFFYDKASQIYQTHSSSIHLDMSVIYNDIGSVYKNTEEYTKALEYFQMALDYQDKSNPLAHSNLVLIYNNMAEVHKVMKQYSDALNILEKLSTTYKRSSVLYDYPTMSIIYISKAEVYFDMGSYSEALELFRKVSNMYKCCHPQNFIDIANVYNRIGEIYQRWDKHLKAFAYYEQSLKNYHIAFNILFKQLPMNVSNLAILYSKIAHVHTNMNNYSMALTLYQKSLEILERSFQFKHPDLASTYANIGHIYKNMGKHDKALISYRQAMKIARQSLPENHRHFLIYQKYVTEFQQTFQ